VWQSALDQLRLVVPVATFDTLFANSTGQTRDDGALVVTVANPHARDWIEARLSTYVTDALRSADFSGPIVFQPRSTLLPLAHGPDRGSLPGSAHGDLPVPGPAKLEPGDVALSFLNFDLYARGWLRTPSYYELFWQPLLGYLPFAYWRQMQALFWSNPPDSFTRRVRLDIQKSAAHLGVSRDLVRGKPARGLGGALKILGDLGLASVERHAAGRATIYTGRFLRRLPLLAPAQAARLSQSQQQQHIDWLLAAGCDLRLWEALGEDYSTFILPATGVGAADGRHTDVGLVTDEGRPPELRSEAIPFFDPPWDSEQLARLGFLRTPVYYDLFLQPLIGPVAYAIWRACKCLNWTTGSQTYTEDTVTSVYALAAILNCNRQKITGVKRRKEGTPYWQDGAFDRLRQERLALIREEGKGSQLAYRMLVVNEPPLLCPSQVIKFGNLLQDAHARWLKRAQLQLEEWQQLPMDSLLALMVPAT
jgi:hypothetical protein